MQINPHFFYNSFFAVRGMLELGDTDAAGKMLENIGRYFQFITRSGRDTVMLMEELSHAKAYLEIQKIRFENISVLLSEPPETVTGLMVPRLILQPLIENAYIYGLEDKQGEGSVEIRFNEEVEALKIMIRDDGGRMTDEKISVLRERLNAPDEGETTGIINIHSRLRLFYGPAASIEVSRNEVSGLTLVMTIPKAAGGASNE
jgi:two-component system sensor histidine kinase YesM